MQTTNNSLNFALAYFAAGGWAPPAENLSGRVGAVVGRKNCVELLVFVAFWHADRVRCRMKDARPGDVLPVKDDYHYPLPGGLRAGDVVRLVAFDHGYWTVEKDGRQFRVFMCCVQSSFEYEIGGRWVSSDDWRVKALRPRA